MAAQNDIVLILLIMVSLVPHIHVSQLQAVTEGEFLYIHEFFSLDFNLKIEPFSYL